jgi:hypothetical protein
MEFLMLSPSRRAGVPHVRLLAAFVALFVIAGPLRAEATWFEAGDLRLRADLQLLNDAGVMRVPLQQWPLPQAAVRHALRGAKQHLATNAAVFAALDRVRARLGDSVDSLSIYGYATLGEPSLLRSFGTLGRESSELGAGMKFSQGRFASTLKVAVVSDPQDGQSVRADGSHATVQLGNWLLSANMLDRWWGPFYEGSLILSNNARPMPSVMIERATARPFDFPVLEWLGPWRFSLGLSQMEHDRADIDAPYFLAMRVSIMPTEKLELGASRTAQFCGKQQTCDASTVIDLLIGNDNPGFDATDETEPGNQLAGFDMRWASPIGEGPYAVYAQMIGEDESGYLPSKYLEQFGLEVWKPSTRGDMLHLFAEYADSTCSASRRSPYFDCAYTQTRFNAEGYRYRGRTLGYSADNDAELYAVGFTYSRLEGDLWSATMRGGRLNRDGIEPDLRNTVSPVAADYFSAEAGWQGHWNRSHFSIQVGAESYQADGADRDIQAFGFLTWAIGFTP